MFYCFKDNSQFWFINYEEWTLKELWSFRPLILIFCQTWNQKWFHLFAYFLLFISSYAKRHLLNFLLYLPFIFPKKVKLLKQELICNDTERPNIYFSCILLLVVNFRSHERISSKSFRKTLLLSRKSKVPQFVTNLCCSVLHFARNKNIFRF